MTDYNIEIEISIDEGIIKVNSFSGEYIYDLNSAEGGNIVSKTIGSDAPTTVYAQNRTFDSMDEYNDWADKQDEERVTW